MSKARPITDPIKRNMMIPLHWFAFLDVPITIWLRRESALFDISRPGSPNQRLSLRRVGAFRVRSPSIRARIDRGASAIYDEAVRAHGSGLALPCGFVESVGRKQFQRGHFTCQSFPQSWMRGRADSRRQRRALGWELLLVSALRSRLRCRLSISRNPLFGAIGQWRKCWRAGCSFFAIA